MINEILDNDIIDEINNEYDDIEDVYLHEKIDMFVSRKCFRFYFI